jgi:multidrug efflux pump subunit AcrA (membrane-fusion protein)
MKAWTSIGAAVLLAAATGATALRRTGPTAVVASGPVEQRIVARGVVRPTDGMADVVATREGRVLRVFVQRGDRVEAGQVLAELEPEANPITSPIAGVVLARRIDPGDTLSRAEPMAPFQIADVSKTGVEIEVEQSDAAKLAVGLSVRLTSTGGRELIGAGTVSRLAQDIARRTLGSESAGARAEGWVRSAWVEWGGDGMPAHAFVGQQVEAQILVATRQSAARVPREAVVVRDGRTVVDAKWGLWSYAIAVEPHDADEGFVELEGVPVGTTVFLR